MADENPIKYSDLIKPDDSIDELIKKLGILINTYEHLNEVVTRDAKNMVSAMKTTSGATEQGRKQIDEEAKQAEKLAAAQRSLTEARSDAAKQIAILNELKKQQIAANKEDAKAAMAQSGSYNDLSAQYSKLKRELNNMNPVTEEARKIFKEKQQAAKALYEQMNELQKATGKYVLQVGNYNIAGESMRNVIKQGKDALNEMEQAGKKNTAEYQQMAAAVAQMTDQMSDTNAMINHMASDTWALDATLQAISVGTGGFAVATGAMQLFGGESEEVQEAQKKLQAAIAMVNGVTAIQNALQKQSALVTGIKKLFTKQLTTDTIENTAATGANTAAVTAQAAATKGATAATSGFSKALNALKANPIMLIITALAAAVVGTIALVGRLRREQEREYQQQLKNLEAAEAKQKVSIQGYENELSAIRHTIKAAEAEGKSKEEIMRLQEEELAIRNQMSLSNDAYYKKEIDNLEANKKKRAENEELLKKAEAEQIKLKDYQIDTIKAENDLLDKQIEIAEQQIEIDRQLDIDGRKMYEMRRQYAIETAKAEEDAFRNLEDARNSLIKNSFARQRTITKANYARQRADIEAELKNNVDLTETQRKHMTDLIVALGDVEKAELKKIAQEEQAANIAAMRETENMRIALMDEGMAKEREELRVNYERQTEDLRTKLQNDTDLTTTQRAELNKQLLIMQEQYLKNVSELNDKARIDELNAELKAIELRNDARSPKEAQDLTSVLRAIEIRREIELKANRQLAVEMRQDEAAINAKYDMERMKEEDNVRSEVAMNALTLQQNLAKSEIDLLTTTDKKKNALRLELEKERLEKQLELNKDANIKMSAEEEQTIRNTIAKIEKDIKKERAPQDIYDVLGLKIDDEQKEALNESFQYAKDVVTNFYEYKAKLAEQAVDAANREVEAAQNALNSEREARAAGYANNVAMAEKELAAAKQQQRKALRQQQETQKAQQRLQTIEQAVNMVTASAKVFSQFGMPYALPVIALMWGAFAASKIKAKQLESEQYGEGTIELLEGGSHQSGNDIDLGRKKDGTRRRAEGGEFFAVINKRSSRKYRKEIPNIINSLNRGDFAEKYSSAYDGAQITIAKFDGKEELRSIASDMREIKERNKTTITYTADGWVERRGNITRIVHK
jgi:hypothetical protein